MNPSSPAAGAWQGRRLLLVLFLLTLPLVSPKFRGADEIQYFSHLRSAVFDRDFDFGNEYLYFYERDPQGLAGFKATFLDRREELTGRPINFAPVGSALLWAPFYLLAHVGVLAARALGAGVAADGLAPPYLAAAALGSALYGFAGLLLLHDLLRRVGGFAEPHASWSIAALTYGSPLLYYLTVAPGFAHAPSLFAVSLMLWLWLTRPEGGLGRWALVGAAGGLAALVREQELLFLAVPGVYLAWRIATRGELARGLARGAVMGAAALAVFTPQLLVYHALNGRYGPSQLVQRKLTPTSPHFFEVLFDPGHGVFVWCPLLLVSCAGLWVAYRRAGRGPGDEALPPRLIVTALTLGLLLQVWINGALESWSQAGAFGSRRFVSSTPVFAWGLAALLSAAGARLPRRLLSGALVVALWWNVSLMVQFGLRLMDRQRLEWPRVAVNQVSEVPRRLGRTLWLYVTDRERLVKETR